MRLSKGKTLVAVAAVLVTSACGDSGANAGGGAGGSGDPIVVGSINTESSPSGAFAMITDAAEAYFTRINEEGGIDGRQIEFLRCDDEGDPAKGEDCGRRMVEKGAVAVLGGIAFSSAAFLPILEAAEIPYVGGLTLFDTDYSNQNFYPVTNAGGHAALAANAWFLLNEDLDKGATLYADVGAPDPTLTNIIEENGGKVEDIAFPPTAADLTPFIQSALRGDPEFVNVATDGPNTVRVVTGLRSAGFDGQITALGTASDAESLKAMGEAGNGVVFSGFYDDPVTSQKPEYVQFREDLEANGNGAAPSGFSLNGYLAAYVTAEALRGVEGEITPQSFTESLTSISGLDQFFDPPLDASAATEDYPRTYYFTAKQTKLQDGQLVPALDYYYDWRNGERLGDWTTE
jgi:branched-chain amino acid transport system substrate-binding protein